MTQWKVTFVNDKDTIQKAEEKLIEAEVMELRGKTATYYDRDDVEIDTDYNVVHVERVIE
ncbi:MULTISPECIES: hypothetical protein [Pseudomonas]|uniref:Uncharacterized protein n=1 Tax=Pseudomonas luteola TaxID=47886 RepID=A0A2X2ELH0_PSELU|nr:MULTISPECIES: hypothetical protein [Pseudomonas]MBF8642273.1 hypothetical protein [Pseudomonas zeshuii]RRW48343.1 hypothetical protein EGJ50_10310 [Pseudomonas luteola]SHJ24350.1 hypothetical protein SAMN05216295_109221 [Pseudomonas zeshuii]SPZ07520.1 Uncharacterised protein [Pseudomonas luteola]